MNDGFVSFSLSFFFFSGRKMVRNAVAVTKKYRNFGSLLEVQEQKAYIVGRAADQCHRFSHHSRAFHLKIRVTYFIGSHRCWSNLSDLCLQMAPE